MGASRKSEGAHAQYLQQSAQGSDPKRRRVVRACDRCRKLKIKCSGDLPCIHCTVYSYDCTYDEPSKTKKRPQPALRGAATQMGAEDGPQRVRALEDVIRKLMPELSGQPIDPYKLRNTLAGNVSVADLADGGAPALAGAAGLASNSASGTMGPSNGSGVAGPAGSAGPNGMEIKIILPPLHIALDLISNTWENACVLFRFYHRPSFINDLNELYSTDPAAYTNKQQRFLPLVYSVLACGALFSKSHAKTMQNVHMAGVGRGGSLIDANIPPPPPAEVVAAAAEGDDGHMYDDEGYKYFIAARRLIDITDTRDTYGIQTIVMLIIFLQCSARLSTCYAYIGIALRAALREGLHRKLNYPFNPIELEIRKRLFWTIYKMDIYVNTMLGLPRTITREDFDQDMPVELDDENITLDGLNFSNQFRVSSSQIANAHTKLIEILKNVVTKLYPVRPKAKGLGSVLTLSYVLELETQLEEWLNALPIELRPGIEPNPEYLRASRVLHLSYLHVRVVLYRPFIHYIGRAAPSGAEWMGGKAQNCVNVVRVVVKLADDMIERGILSGAYWFSVYTIFFSIACLVYYVHFSPNTNSSEYAQVKKDAERGKRILDTLKDSSMAARRTYNILNALFEQLNRKTAGTVVEDHKESPLENSDLGVGVSNGINYIGGVSTGVNLSEGAPAAAGAPQPSEAMPESDPYGVNSSEAPDDAPYAPGLMDQLDTKLFGRFLPPYMTAEDDMEGTFAHLPEGLEGHHGPESIPSIPTLGSPTLHAEDFADIPASLSTALPPTDTLADFLNLQ